MRNQLLKEFNDFKELPLTKILKNQLKDNNDIGFTNFKFNGPDVIGICYSCKEIANILTVVRLFLEDAGKNDAIQKENISKMKKLIESISTLNLVLIPYIFSVEKFTNFKDKYTPGFLARFGLFITRNSSEIKFVHKIAALSKELVGEIKNFGFLNADINDKSIKLSLSADSPKDEAKNDLDLFGKSTNISVKHKDTKEFFLFILHKANTFDKNNIYGSFLKKLHPDNSLREVIGNMLKNVIDSAKLLRDILPFFSNKIEELQQRLNQVMLRLKTDKNLDWVQDEITKNIFWVFEMLVSTFIENKNTILEILNDTRAAKERKDEDLMDKNLTALRHFLVEFSNSYADKKFGASEESNLHESLKFLRNKILTELPRNKDILKIIGDYIQVFLDNYDNSEDAEGSGANVSFNAYESLGLSSNTDDPDEIKNKILYELVSEGILCMTRFLMCFY
ncbi:hypothetical protein CWI37_0203p0050 [Hamiltosporidium tvaerminnensis]|uniref:Uncharacterized protein n=1 Tax=Hamiltosporidium tvaerminnensis TaxID=1176355 RepID=A0A4Q9LAD5_9MICR|nr:hypothetical protein CWI37_0203p0050 [Hamiltosporidium tvaerminnensis]